MSAETLEALEKEFAAEGMDQIGAPEMTPEEQAEAEANQPRQMEAEGLAQIVAPIIGTAGGVICRMAHVTNLEPEEVEALSGAVANVAQYYDIQMTDKQAAWLGLGMCAMAVVGNRKPLAPPPEPEPEGEPANENKPPYADAKAPENA